MKPFATITELMPHQKTAIDKILSLRVGALFAEMGTGKSRMAIELARQRNDIIDQVVWFCPVALKDTIRHEIFKHTDCAPEDIHSFDAKTNEGNVPAASWHIVGIESMSSSSRVIVTVFKLITENTMIILDESSYIKGHDSDRTLRLTQYSEKARYRLILTGTPISQGVVDLYAQMRFLSPKILGYNSFYAFAANHLEYSDKYPGMIVRAHNVPFLTKKIHPYTYQITKEECMRLPPKLYENRYVTMMPDQLEAYQEAKDEILGELENCESDYVMTSFAIFRLFSALQSIVCGFWNRRNEDNDMEKHIFPTNRPAQLLDAISEIPKKEKIIIWAKYHYDIQLIHSALQEAYGPDSTALFHGAVPERDRPRQINKFRNDARFFVATQSCGGHGLTLNEASHVIYYSNGFKYSDRLKSEDRCHRIGQCRSVTYIDLICGGTIDDRVSIALYKKGNVVEHFKQAMDKVKGNKVKLKEMVAGL